MSDDLGNKIKQIADILSREDLPDNLKSLLSLLGNSSGKENNTSDSNETLKNNSNTDSGKPEDRSFEKSQEKSSEKNSDINSGRNSDTESDLNMDMIRKIKKVLDNINVKNDPRVALLTSLKPFMNKNRQKKINNCIQMLTMSKVIRSLDESDKNAL